jgi:hypothetical protein
MWERIEDRLALLELLTEGTLKRRAAQSRGFAWLSELSWTRATGRRNVIRLVAERRAELVELLDRVWPEWKGDHLALVVAGEPPTPAGWTRLGDMRRADALPDIPAQINRRTAAAATAARAKSSLTGERREVLGEVEITDDGVARLRPPPGLEAHRRGRRLPLDRVVAVLGEVGISDRALRDGLQLQGAIDAVLTVENLGAWRDLPAHGRWLYMYVPGWNTTTVRQLLTAIPSVPVVHFGDLDPNGVRIYRHLRECVPNLGWLVPEFWGEFVQMHAQKREWPDGLDLADAPALARSLAQQDLWLEQERVVLDPRLLDAMDGLLHQHADL